jgi:sulfite exporter TauE/SafE
MTLLDVSVPLALGVVSSLHCSQMCGPIVLAYSLPLSRSAVAPHIAYNFGRIATYSLLGAIAGAAGGGISSLGRIAGIERAAALVAGFAMIVAALLMSTRWQSQALIRIGGSSTGLARIAARLLKSGDPLSKLALGLVLGFMPCGLIYAALIKAADAGSASGGALSMCAFGVGTSGALLAIGLFSSSITARFGRYANQFATIGVTLIGIFLLARGFGFGSGAGHGHHAN